MSIKDKAVELLINTSSNLAGATAGSALGFLFSGPEGALIGGAIGNTFTDVLKNIGSEVIDKKLSMTERQIVRSGATYCFAIDKIKQKLEAGETPVESFFQNDMVGGRIIAEELLEGVLIKAKDEYEEKKLKYLGYLYGNITFRNNITKQTCTQLINLASKLTYRQYCILAMIKNIEKYNLSREDFRDKNISFPTETLYFLQEIFDLYNINLIRCDQINSPDSEVFLGLTDIAPGRLKLQWIGDVFYNLMNLNEIDERETLMLANLIATLR